MSQPRLVCLWDEKPIVPRSSGKPQKYCCPECSDEFQQAKRDYAQQQLDRGAITIDDIKAARAAKLQAAKEQANGHQ
jgi:hypothetical protein